MTVPDCDDCGWVHSPFAACGEERHVWYIHGANSSPRSFAWLADKMPDDHTAINISYDHSRSLSDTLAILKDSAAAARYPFHIIAHSIGGVLALGIANAFPEKVKSVVTLATPFHGCQAAALLRWVAPCPLFDDIHPYSSFITTQRLLTPQVPMLSVVTTAGGTPVISGPNDGVVTVASQMSLKGPIYRQVPANHFEVLLDQQTADLAKDFLFGSTMH